MSDNPKTGGMRHVGIRLSQLCLVSAGVAILLSLIHHAFGWDSEPWRIAALVSFLIAAACFVGVAIAVGVVTRRT